VEWFKGYMEKPVYGVMWTRLYYQSACSKIGIAQQLLIILQNQILRKFFNSLGPDVDSDRTSTYALCHQGV
jgi:hypothetical protein